VCGRIGIPYQALPRRNVTERQPYQVYYDAENIQLVAQHWAREIEQFDFAFTRLDQQPI